MGGTAMALLEKMLHVFDEERTVTFKGEIYLVRDNGAILRRTRSDTRRRKLDERWTFGMLNKSSGYLVICDHIVHQIVATAFHGPRPSSEYVVDHFDTNRQNNRPENLHWVTRLENALGNPITRKRIELAFGSIEDFLANPGAQTISNLEWMRSVTKEEAQESYKRLLEWADKKQAPRGGTLGEWVYQRKTFPDLKGQQASQDRPSLTPGAFQRQWRTPTEFPHCPETTEDDAVGAYLSQLQFGAIFARNQYGESIVVASGIDSDGNISVLCNTQTGVKGWSLAKVYVEQEKFCHEGRTYFTLQGALKAHCQAIEEPFEESIDDYA